MTTSRNKLEVSRSALASRVEMKSRKTGLVATTTLSNSNEAGISADDVDMLTILYKQTDDAAIVEVSPAAISSAFVSACANQISNSCVCVLQLC